MKVLGIVLELNPPHYGHKYFIDKAKEETQCDYTIAIISSSFSMRGDIMVIDKFSKAKIALELGVDLVLDFPYISYLNSSDYFCYNAIKILSSFNITDIAFGVELFDYNKLIKISKLLDSKEYNLFLKNHLDKGFSYSSSSLKAIKELTNDDEIIQNYSLPNNTLAIGYLRAIEIINKDIKVHLIKRINNNYYDETITQGFNSASSLRKLLKSNQSINSYCPIDFEYLNPSIAENNLLFILKYLFNNEDISNFTEIYGVSEGIENRIKNFIDKSNTYDELVKNIQTKRYNENRIKRLLIHIALKTPIELMNKYHYYLRVLAMNEKGTTYLGLLPKNIKKEIITSFKNRNDYITESELKATKLFGLLYNKNDVYLEEYNTPYKEK